MRFVRLHAGHASSSRAPHPLQNFAPARFSCRHRGHCAAALTASPSLIGSGEYERPNQARQTAGASGTMQGDSELLRVA